MVELEIRPVRYFLAVVEHGSFTRAAAALHLSQPALSQAVRRLEALVGTDLFDRGVTGSHGGVTLTTAGAAFRPAADELVRVADLALKTVRAAVRPVSLTIGFGTDTPRRLIRRLLRVADQTTIDVTLLHLRWGLERQALADGDVDLIFLQAPPDLSDPALRLFAVDEVHRVAVFPRQHRLADRDSITMAEIADEPIIDAGSNRAYWLVDPRPDGRSPHVVGPPAQTADEMLTFVAAHQGMVITSSSVAATNQSEELAFVPIVDLDPATIYLAARTVDGRAGVETLLRTFPA